jgi:hypothetical protein
MNLSSRLHRLERSLSCPSCGATGDAAAGVVVSDETCDSEADGRPDDMGACPTCGRTPKVIRIVDEDELVPDAL